MLNEQYMELKKNMKIALRRNCEFLYCPKGQDGEPVLLIGKRIPHTVRVTLRKTARKKIIVLGEVGNHNGRLEFRTDAQQRMLKKHLVTIFGRRIPQLKKAQIISMEEYAERRQPTHIMPLTKKTAEVVMVENEERCPHCGRVL